MRAREKETVVTILTPPTVAEGTAKENSTLASARCSRGTDRAKGRAESQPQWGRDKGLLSPADDRPLSVSLRAGGWSWCPGVASHTRARARALERSLLSLPFSPSRTSQFWKPSSEWEI